MLFNAKILCRISVVKNGRRQLPAISSFFFEKRLKWESGMLVNSVLMKDKGSYSGHDKMKSSYELKANTLKFF